MGPRSPFHQAEEEAENCHGTGLAFYTRPCYSGFQKDSARRGAAAHIVGSGESGTMPETWWVPRKERLTRAGTCAAEFALLWTEREWVESKGVDKVCVLRGICVGGEGRGIVIDGVVC